jgi:predicted DNA-binding transcriptional regulator YafY
MHPRAVYRVLENLRETGFILVKSGAKYRLDPDSPFFRGVFGEIHFSQDEALAMSQVLGSVSDNSPQVRHLREKLSRLYGDDVLARHAIDDQHARNFRELFSAVSEERLCVLRGYSSHSSGQTRDRIVEPYVFLAENSEVRCYEPESGMNKTFKVSRAESVEILDLRWSFKEKHEPFFTDLFHFSGQERTRVRLVMGSLAASLLSEEYPFAESQMCKLDDGRYLLDTHVCSFKGIGRFVIGLLDDIEIVGSTKFVSYLRERIAGLNVRTTRLP